MPFTPAQDAVIKQALGQKVKGQCPMCYSRDWSVADDIVAFKLPSIEKRETNQNLPPPLKDVLARTVIVPRSLPCIATICNVCGLTLFHNVFTLGLHTTLGIAPEGPVKHG
jgi:hypothetical protein